MSDSLYAWRRLHLIDAYDLQLPWTSKRPAVIDDLLAPGAPPSTRTGAWKCTSILAYERLVGALRVHNPGHDLWFRGEGVYWPTTVPTRMRSASAASLGQLFSAVQALEAGAACQDLIRHRGNLARLAILQHYGVGTSFVDVTASAHVALLFALWRASEAERGRLPFDRTTDEMRRPAPLLQVLKKHWQ